MNEICENCKKQMNDKSVIGRSIHICPHCGYDHKTKMFFRSRD